MPNGLMVNILKLGEEEKMIKFVLPLDGPDTQILNSFWRPQQTNFSLSWCPQKTNFTPFGCPQKLL